jgi:DNA-binding CsgD family transcriptional regulator
VVQQRGHPRPVGPQAAWAARCPVRRGAPNLGRRPGGPGAWPETSRNPGPSGTRTRPRQLALLPGPHAAVVRQMAAPPAPRGRIAYPLRSARDGFDALAFPALAEKARQELRAAGETSHRRMPESWDQLTPQELQIARLAASGLSNREIAEQLFISHRTVGYHLHQNLPQAPAHLPQPAPHSLARPGLAAARYGNCRAACHSQPRSSHHTADCHPRGLNRRRTYDLRALGTTIRQAWRPATHHPLRQSPPTWQAGLGTRGGRCALSEFSYPTRHLTP